MEDSLSRSSFLETMKDSSHGKKQTSDKSASRKKHQVNTSHSNGSDKQLSEKGTIGIDILDELPEQDLMMKNTFKVVGKKKLSSKQKPGRKRSRSVIEDYGFGKKDKPKDIDSSDNQSEEDELLENVGELPSMDQKKNRRPMYMR